MNRVIIVGNGFDLAHGLETKYEHFINWYWDRWGMLLRSCGGKRISDGLCSFVLKDEVGLAGWYLVPSFHYSIYPRNISNREFLEAVKNDDKVCDYKMHSAFLARICNSIEAKGWVDIENDYYQMLVEDINNKDSIIKLNKDFGVIQNLLTKYLSEVQNKNISTSIINDNIRRKMLAPFSKEEIAESASIHWTKFTYERGDINSIEAISHIFSDYGISNYSKDEIEKLLKKDQSAILSNSQFSDEAGKSFLLPSRVMLLNFNYTNTADLYLPQNNRFVVNHIHGELTNPNSVIFGYGDETDDEHQVILKKNDNEYLRHFKTYRYLESPNYRQLLSFIESKPFQVCIIGHSCGLSDRTMLKTIFEHKNCVSIKPYYYINESGSDNYLDIVQNISRNFTDMSKMRDRIVNKTYCSSL